MALQIHNHLIAANDHNPYALPATVILIPETSAADPATVMLIRHTSPFPVTATSMQHTVPATLMNNKSITSHCDFDKRHFNTRSIHTGSHYETDSTLSQPKVKHSKPSESESSTGSPCESNASACTNASDQQLWLRIPINYNETLLK